MDSYGKSGAIIRIDVHIVSKYATKFIKITMIKRDFSYCYIILACIVVNYMNSSFPIGLLFSWSLLRPVWLTIALHTFRLFVFFLFSNRRVAK